MKNIRFPWWASPSTLLVISLLVVFYAIVFVDDEQYNIWKTPRYVTHVEAVEVGSVIVAVLLGIVVAASISQRNNENYVADTAKFLKSRQLNTLFYIFTVLTIIGYSIWIIKAFHSGLTGAEVLATIKGDPGAVSQLKGTAQPTAGLTTLTQFGSLVVVLGILRDRLAEKNSKLIVWFVLFLSVLRFVFYAERIAFLEVAVPAVILAASLWPTKVRWPSARKWITNILPIVLGLFVFILFAVGEYSRSWAVLRTQTSQPTPSLLSAASCPTTPLPPTMACCTADLPTPITSTTQRFMPSITCRGVSSAPTPYPAPTLTNGGACNWNCLPTPASPILARYFH